MQKNNYKDVGAYVITTEECWGKAITIVKDHQPYHHFS